MESFTDRVEKLERRLMDRDWVEKKWRNDVGKKIDNVEELGYGHMENTKTVWKEIKKLEWMMEKMGKTTEKLEGTVEKLRVVVEEWLTDDDDDEEKTEGDQDVEGDEEMTGLTKEKEKVTEGMEKTEKKTEEKEEADEEEELEETLKGDVEMTEG
jgi:hypothetical protein